jgi:hypothetical protein
MDSYLGFVRVVRMPPRLNKPYHVLCTMLTDQGSSIPCTNHSGIMLTSVLCMRLKGREAAWNTLAHHDS